MAIPQLANSNHVIHARLSERRRCSAKHREHSDFWSSCGGKVVAKLASEPANLHPQAEVQREEAPTSPVLGTRCHFPLGLARNPHSLRGKASTSTAADLFMRASRKEEATAVVTSADDEDEEDDADAEAPAARRKSSGLFRSSSSVAARPTLAAQVLAASRGASRMYSKTVEDPQRPNN